jgi:hypothetical protein
MVICVFRKTGNVNLHKNIDTTTKIYAKNIKPLSPTLLGLFACKFL